MGNDPKGLVYSGQDNSGAAAIFQGGVDPNAFYIAKKRAQEQSSTASKEGDRLLAEVGVNMGTAWDQDLPDLKESYRGLVEQLKEYEKERDKDKKRELWYGVQEARADLRNAVNKSAKARATFTSVAGRMAGDDKWRYSEDDYTALDDWKKTKLKDRSDFPAVQAANTQSALNALIKNVKYKADVKTDKWTNSDGTGGSKTRTIIDEGELHDAIIAAIPTLPENMQYALKVDQRELFHKLNPGITSLPYEEQEQKFNDFLADRAKAVILPGLGQRDVTVVNNKASKSGGSSGGGSAYANANGIWDVKRLSGDEQYFVSVQPNSKSGVKAPVMDKITITGKEYKDITGFTTVGVGGENVEDDKLYTIDAIVSGVVLSPGQKPVMRIQPVDVLSGKLKQGTVKDVSLSSYNESVLMKYGAYWKDVFWDLKSKADAEWNRSSKSSGAPTTGKPGSTPTKGRAAGPTGGTGSGAGKAPAPAQKSYAPSGWPALSKPIQNLSDDEYKAYKAKLTPQQKIQLIVERKKRKNG